MRAFMVGDFVTIRKTGQDAIINGMDEKGIHCIDFCTKEQINGVFTRKQLKKATYIQLAMKRISSMMQQVEIVD